MMPEADVQQTLEPYYTEIAAIKQDIAEYEGTIAGFVEQFLEQKFAIEAVTGDIEDAEADFTLVSAKVDGLQDSVIERISTLDALSTSNILDAASNNPAFKALVQGFSLSEAEIGVLVSEHSLSEAQIQQLVSLGKETGLPLQEIMLMLGIGGASTVASRVLSPNSKRFAEDKTNGKV